jgi:hypothetical protein
MFVGVLAWHGLLSHDFLSFYLYLFIFILSSLYVIYFYIIIIFYLYLYFLFIFIFFFLLIFSFSFSPFLFFIFFYLYITACPITINDILFYYRQRWKKVFKIKRKNGNKWWICLLASETGTFFIFPYITLIRTCWGRGFCRYQIIVYKFCR